MRRWKYNMSNLTSKQEEINLIDWLIAKQIFRQNKSSFNNTDNRNLPTWLYFSPGLP